MTWFPFLNKIKQNKKLYISCTSVLNKIKQNYIYIYIYFMYLCLAFFLKKNCFYSNVIDFLWNFLIFRICIHKRWICWDIKKAFSSSRFHPRQVLGALMFCLYSLMLTNLYEIMYQNVLCVGTMVYFFQWEEMEDHTLLFLKLVHWQTQPRARSILLGWLQK